MQDTLHRNCIYSTISKANVENRIHDEVPNLELPRCSLQLSLAISMDIVDRKGTRSGRIL